MNRYAEYMSVPEIQFLIKVPDNMSLSVAAMLPSGALWAMNTVRKAETAVQRILEQKGPDGKASPWNWVDPGRERKDNILFFVF
jgi:NADPH:quinone reductase-like Zn-dependent oxidoreductase